MRRVLFRFLLIFTSLSLAHVFVAPAAHAETLAADWRMGAGIVKEKFAGVFRNGANQAAYCADAELGAPWEAKNYISGNSQSFQQRQGKHLDEQERNTVSYLIKKWGDTEDKHQAAAVQFAIWSLTTVDMEFGSEKMNRFAAMATADAAVLKRAQEYRAEAQKNHGPYQLRLHHEAMNLRTQLLGGKQHEVPGFPVEIKSHGSTTLNNKLQDTVVAGSTVPLKYHDFEDANFSAIAHNLPGNLKWYQPAENNAQRILLSSTASDVTTDLKFKVVEPLLLKVSTQTSHKVVSKGQKIFDELKVEPQSSGHRWLINPENQQEVSVTIRSTLWGPFTEKPQSKQSYPEDKFKKGSVETTVRNFGVVKTPELELKESGYYVWTEEIIPEKTVPRTAQKLVNPWKGNFGVEAETSLVKWQINVETDISRNIIKRADSVTDHLKISGFQAKSEKLLKLKVYGPENKLPQLSKETPPQAKLHQEINIAAENGEVVSDEITENQPGCYTIVTEFEGDELHEPYRSAYGDPRETFCVHENDGAFLFISEKEVKQYFEKSSKERLEREKSKDSAQHKERTNSSRHFEKQNSEAQRTDSQSVITSQESQQAPRQESQEKQEPRSQQFLANTGLSDKSRKVFALSLLVTGFGGLMIIARKLLTS
ncbi:MAG: hypothetical protein QM632_00630 [Micrococcaceae bacterium]